MLEGAWPSIPRKINLPNLCLSWPLVVAAPRPFNVVGKVKVRHRPPRQGSTLEGPAARTHLGKFILRGVVRQKLIPVWFRRFPCVLSFCSAARIAECVRWSRPLAPVLGTTFWAELENEKHGVQCEGVRK